MKKIILILLISSIAAFAGVGKITAIKGEVYIDRQSKQIAARVGSVLELKDKIVTKSKSKALLLFNDKTSITVGKNSNLEVQKYVFSPTVASNNQASFKFGQGVFRTLTGKIGKLNKKKFQIKTATASIGIRGTVFDVEVGADGQTLVGVIDGKVTMIVMDQKLDLEPGQKVQYDDETGGVTVVEGSLESTDELNKDSKELNKMAKDSGQETADDEAGGDDDDGKGDGDKEDKEGDKKKAKKDDADDEEGDDTAKGKKEGEDDEDTTPKGDGKEKDNGKTDGDDDKGDDKGTGSDTAGGDKAKPKGTGTGDDAATGTGTGDDTKGTGATGTNTTGAADTKPASIGTTGFNDGTGGTNTGPTPPTAPGDLTGGIDTGKIIDTVTQATKDADDAQDNAKANANKVPVLDSTNEYSLTIDEDSSGTLLVLASDPDTGDVLNYSISGAQKGTASITEVDGKQQITYIPAANENGNDTLTLSVNDGKGGVVTQNITVNITPVNDEPQLSLLNDSASLNIKQSETVVLDIETSDVDGENVVVEYSAVNGTFTIVEGKVAYQAGTDFTGEDTVTLTYKDGSVTKTKEFKLTVAQYVSIANPDKSKPDLATELEAITKEVMSDTADTYMEYGYVLEDVEGIETRTATYITGDLTPAETIQGYITNKNTAIYRGGVSAIVTNGGSSVSSGGSVTLNVDFGQQNLDGQINVNEGNWKAAINSGNVHQYGFNSNDISTAAQSSVENITGDLNGKFYGPAANSAGGTFKLNSPDSGKVDGVFGGPKLP